MSIKLFTTLINIGLFVASTMMMSPAMAVSNVNPAKAPAVQTLADNSDNSSLSADDNGSDNNASNTSSDDTTATDSSADSSTDSSNDSATTDDTSTGDDDY